MYFTYSINSGNSFTHQNYKAPHTLLTVSIAITGVQTMQGCWYSLLIPINFTNDIFSTEEVVI
jgi:hypothetical protein